jgi:hypothetical protein
MNTITTFETGNIYQMTFIGDSDLRPEFICVKRTDKSATFERFQNPSEKITRRIKVWDGSEYVLEASYSMAPCIKASNLVK